MRQAVDAARTDTQPQAQQISRRLAAITDSLNTAMQETRNAAWADIRSELRDDPRFKALPQQSRLALAHSCHEIAMNMPVQEWKTHMDTIKNFFFLPLPPGVDIDAGLRNFQTDFVQIFLRPEQQAQVGENGIHATFNVDVGRCMVAQIGDTAMSPETSSREDYQTALKNIVGEKYQKFLPLISLTASQGGLDSAADSMAKYLGLTPYSLTLLLAGYHLVPAQHSHGTVITREGDDLIIADRFHAKFNSSANPGDSVNALAFKGSIRMRIHLSAQPSVYTVNGKTVLVPQTSMEADELRFTTEQAAGQQ